MSRNSQLIAWLNKRFVSTDRFVIDEKEFMDNAFLFYLQFFINVTEMCDINKIFPNKSEESINYMI